MMAMAGEKGRAWWEGWEGEGCGGRGVRVREVGCKRGEGERSGV